MGGKEAERPDVKNVHQPELHGADREQAQARGPRHPARAQQRQEEQQGQGQAGAGHEAGVHANKVFLDQAEGKSPDA